MAVSAKVLRSIENSSWIRKMFEAGTALRAAHGADSVCDFSLGNPDVEPPAAFQDALARIVSTPVTRKHGYMPNAGYPDVRARVAAQVSREQGVALGRGFRGDVLRRKRRHERGPEDDPRSR